MEQLFSTERQRAIAMTLQPVRVVDVEAQVHLHGDVRTGPGRTSQLLDALEREKPVTGGGAQDKPVGIVRSMSGRFVTRKVSKAEELSVKLGGCPNVSSVNDRVGKSRVVEH